VPNDAPSDDHEQPPSGQRDLRPANSPVTSPANGPATSPVASTVQYAVDGGIATIRLNRPRAGNAIDTVLVEDFYQAVFRAAADPGVRAVLLGGAGPSLSTGGDLAMFARRSAGSNGCCATPGPPTCPASSARRPRR
jgi:2-(1,2-epoxy-1,2-dihydrophenyl)acetyl-CoA isomerase